MMHARGESNSATVAGKPTNKAERSAAEPVEPRAEAKGNARQQSTGRAQSWGTVSQALERIRQAARQRKKEKFTALLHHISTNLLNEVFFELREDAAPGVDGLTWTDYEQTSSAILRTCMVASIGERIGHYRHGERIYPSRMADSARSRLPPWRTRSSNGRLARCSMRSTRKTSSGSRTDSDPGAARTTRWMRSSSGSRAQR